MNASQKLDHYLDSFRARLRKLTLLQGAAVVTFTLLVLSMRHVFADSSLSRHLRAVVGDAGACPRMACIVG